MSVGRGPWQQMQAPPTTGHEQAGGPILTKISDVDGGNRRNGEAVGHNLAICSRRPCSVSAPLLAVRLLARRTLADGCAYSVVASGSFGDLEAIKKRERDGREQGKEGNKRDMDMKEKLLVAHLEKKAERYISHQYVKTPPRATCGYIHLCPSPQLASPGSMAGPRPAGRCLLSNGLRFSQTGCGSEQKGEAWARSQLERSL